MESCEYCGTPFIKGESCDIGVGFMQVTADEPNCDCYNTYTCPDCGASCIEAELEEHELHCEAGDDNLLKETLE